jgi:DNA-binding response OmpR family regulator
MSQRTVLIVLTEAPVRTSVAAALSAQGYEVLVATTFQEGRRLLLERRPEVLVTALRLHEHNGIHLAVVSRLRSANTRTIVLGYGDPVLEAEAGQAGAVYLRDATNDDVLAAVSTALHRRERRWPRARANLTALAADQTVRLLDVSYGGFRIEFSPGAAPPAGDGFDLQIGGLSVYASAVWMKQQANERLSCGAAISSELQKSEAWRELVDEALSH